MKQGIPPIHSMLDHQQQHGILTIHDKLSTMVIQSSNVSKPLYQNVILSSSSSITALSISLASSSSSSASLSQQKETSCTKLNHYIIPEPKLQVDDEEENNDKQQYQHEYNDILLNEQYHEQLNFLESSFLFFDWTIYDEYQGFLDKDTFCVGSPPPWVKPAFNNANNGRLLPMPAICTNHATTQENDDHRLKTTSTIDTLSPVTPTFFNNNNNNNGYDDSLFDIHDSSHLHGQLYQHHHNPYLQQTNNGKKLKRSCLFFCFLFHCILYML
ncbi:hypothetical protein BJ944DRAFT_44441 [Cunninghamella echinulata]|nr:hypothetical protein BJ944DRAFT_44441 [Cunninghamella echinulata]